MIYLWPEQVLAGHSEEPGVFDPLDTFMTGLETVKGDWSWDALEWVRSPTSTHDEASGQTGWTTEPF